MDEKMNSWIRMGNVTLICVDCLNTDRAALVLEHCKFGFGDVKLLTSLPTNYKHAVQIGRIGSQEEYSAFCLRELYKHFDTSHCLVVQWDGWVCNPIMWKDEWLGYDYVGCVTWWTGAGPDGKGGNGGFSLRSRRLMEEASRIVEVCHPEDTALSAKDYKNGMREEFEKRGFRFAPRRVQECFGTEFEEDVGKKFGFHSADAVRKWYGFKGYPKGE